ncbi:MAG: phage holin family protein [Christensenellales bacterium]
MDILIQYNVPVITGICLCVGYIFKHCCSFIPNRYIPLLMGSLGLIINVLINHGHFSADIVLSGLFSGLASTGFYNMCKK